MRIARLRDAFGGDREWFDELARYFATDRRTDPTYRQDTRGQVRDHLAAIGVPITPADAEMVRAACCLPGPVAESLRTGALEALRSVKDRGLRVAICSNVMWRTGADSRVDWAARGAGALIDAYVTSIDVGWLKPHRAMFDAALSTLGVVAAETVMVGDSGFKDIAPAKRLGLRAVHVRSGDAALADPPADVMIDELGALPAALAGLGA